MVAWELVFKPHKKLNLSSRISVKVSSESGTVDVGIELHGLIIYAIKRILPERADAKHFVLRQPDILVEAKILFCVPAVSHGRQGVNVPKREGSGRGKRV